MAPCHPPPSSHSFAKRRPLPTPPLTHQPSSSSSLLATPHDVPSSPPPPYSRFLPPEHPADSSSAVTSTSRSTLSHPQHPTPCGSFRCPSPPPNTWIAVETCQSEYVLRVRLPGFRRDGISIATRRRRILHIVADSGEPECGRLERRVSFGYDAVLAQVRAEFDGATLRIVVPRRIPAIAS